MVYLNHVHYGSLMPLGDLTKTASGFFRLNWKHTQSLKTPIRRPLKKSANIQYVKRFPFSPWWEVDSRVNRLGITSRDLISLLLSSHSSRSYWLNTSCSSQGHNAAYTKARPGLQKGSFRSLLWCSLIPFQVAVISWLQSLLTPPYLHGKLLVGML